MRFKTFGETKAVFTLDAWVQRPSAVLVGTVKVWGKFALVQFYGYLENELYSIL